MMSKAFIAALCLALTAGSAAADAPGPQPRKRERVVRTLPSGHAVRVVRTRRIVPDCFERFGDRLVSCAPRVYLREPYSLETLTELQGPPERLQRPYPSLFSWPYGMQ